MKAINIKNILCSDNWQIFRFFVIGVGATSIHLIIAETIIWFSCIDNVFSVNFLSFLAALIFSYFGHRYITFSKSGSFLRFFIVSGLGFFINNLILKLGILIGIDKRIAIGLAILSVPILTYVFSKLWVFK